MSTYHVIPRNDLMEHDTSGDTCLCGPKVEPLAPRRRVDGLAGAHTGGVRRPAANGADLMTRSEYLDLIHPLLARLDVKPEDLVSVRLDADGIEYVLFDRDASGHRIPGHKRMVTRRVTSED